MPEFDLQTIGTKCGTDKATPHTYLPVYDALFSHLRHQPITVLEIGIWRGASIRMWLEYFTQAKIIGLDHTLLHDDLPQHARVSYYECNQTDSVRMPALFKDEPLTIVIDDGGHIPDEQRVTMNMLWPYMVTGGLYCIEDICSGYDKELATLPDVWIHSTPKKADDTLAVRTKR